MADIDSEVQIAALVDVEPLKPYDANARVHSATQIEQLKASIRQFGFVGVIGYDERGLAIGHGRRQAALEMWAAGEEVLGPGKRAPLPTGKLPAIDLTGLNDAERRALIIADNALALSASWDEELLRAELEALQLADFDIGIVGFDPAELDRLFNPPQPGLTDPDALPDEPEKAASVRGDVWVLGNHRLKCGDATDAADVESVLVGKTPHLMVTDPPYGVNYDASWRNNATAENFSFRNTRRAVGKVDNDDVADWRNVYKLFAGDVVYVWHAGNKGKEVTESLEACGFAVRSQIIWAKQHFVVGRSDYHPQHEPCFYCVRKGKTGHYVGGRKQSTLWQIDALMPVGRKGARGSHVGDEKTEHSTQKPVECMRRPIINNSKAGDLVYEPFSGSGTTLIAAEMEGRHCRAIELNPAYVDMGVLRWQDFTGSEATLEATGQTFAEVKAEREAEVEAA